MNLSSPGTRETELEGAEAVTEPSFSFSFELQPGKQKRMRIRFAVAADVLLALSIFSCALCQQTGRPPTTYLCQNWARVDATSVVVALKGQKIFAVVLLKCVGSARRGSYAELCSYVLPGLLLCALE